MYTSSVCLVLLPILTPLNSYLYKTVVPGNPLDDAKLLVETVGSLLRANALRPQTGPAVTFGQKAKEEVEAKEKALA